MDTDHKKIGGILVEIILIIVLHTELGKVPFLPLQQMQGISKLFEDMAVFQTGNNIRTQKKKIKARLNESCDTEENKSIINDESVRSERNRI